MACCNTIFALILHFQELFSVTRNALIIKKGIVCYIVFSQLAFLLGQYRTPFTSRDMYFFEILTVLMHGDLSSTFLIFKVKNDVESIGCTLVRVSLSPRAPLRHFSHPFHYILQGIIPITKQSSTYKYPGTIGAPLPPLLLYIWAWQQPINLSI